MGVLSTVQAAQDDAESTVADTSDDNGAKALVGALGSVTNPTTTEEAKSYARKFLDRNLTGEQTEGEEPILAGLQKNAEAARAALQKARESLLATQAQAARNSETDKWLAVAQGFGAPTKSGSFFENLSDWSGQERKRRAEDLAQQQQFNTQGTNLDLQSSDVDQNLLNARLALQKLHEQNTGAMGKEALNILGRPALNPKNSAPTNMSPEGKEALDILGPQAYGTPQFQTLVNKLVATKNAALRARAGIDVTGDDSPQTIHEVANLNGVPANVPDPFAGLSTRAKLQAQANEQRVVDKKQAEYPAQDAQYQAGLRAIDEFQKLNQVTETGPQLAKVGLGGVHAGLHGVGADTGGNEGWNINPLSVIAGFKPNIQQMEKDVALLTPLVVPEKGFGRVTNRDLGLFQSGMVGIDKAKQANDAIAQAIRIRLQNDLDRHEFEQNYFNTHQHMRGAEASWNKYLNDNPIFDPSDPNQGKAGHYTLNPNRMSYADYFRAQNAQTHAEGGPVHFAEGGSTDDGYKDTLAALKEGVSLKGAGAQENPNSPVTNFTGEAVGAGGLAATLLALSRLGRRVGLGGLSRIAAEHPNIASTVAGGTTGAVAGGLGSHDADPTYDALAYGITGAGLGLGARYGVKGLTELGGRSIDALTGNTVNAGDRRVLRAMQADNPDLNDIASRLRADARMRVPSTLADASGPRTQGLAGAALIKDTPETRVMAGDLANRQEGTNTRVQEQVNRALAPDPYLTKMQELTTQLYANAAPLYDAAYKQFPAVKSPALLDLMNTPAGQEAASRAFTKMQNLQLPIGQPDVTGMVRAPSLQYLDYVKRSLDDMITQEEGNGANYSATDDGRILRGMRNKLLTEIDTATRGPNGQPGPYQEARQQYAGDLEVRDALRSGNEDFNRMTPAELQQKVANMSYAERDAFRSGVAENLFQRLNQTSENVNPAARITNTPGIQDKIGAIFEKPSEANRFLTALGREEELFDTSKPLLGAAKRGAANSQVPPSLATRARATLMSPDTAGQITTTLNTVGPDAQAALQRLRNSADRLRARTETGNLLGTAAAAGVGAAITPSAQQQPAQ